MAGDHPDGDELDAALRDLGHERFRPGQRGSAEALLAGRDVLAVLATGSGKSLIYELVARLAQGPAVVVSPLVALMRDQARRARAGGLSVARLDSARGGDRRLADELERIASAEACIALVTPERLERPDVRAAIGGSGPSVLAVDEAHAVCDWGRGFRPAYLSLRDSAEAIGRPPILAMTATANPVARREIIDRLGLRDPLVVVHGVDRPSIFLEVVRIEREQDELPALEALLDGAVPAGAPDALARGLVELMDGRGIVYTRTTASARRCAEALRARGIDADHYHGRRRRDDRERVERGFRDGSPRVIAATNAFGLGIDVPDVRFVIHLHPPANLDAYHQEAGRAGRDGRLARGTLIHRPAALSRAAFIGSAGALDRDDAARVAEALPREGHARPEEIAERAGLPLGTTTAMLDVMANQRLVSRRGRSARAAPGADPATVSLEREERRVAYERSRIEMMRAYAEGDGCRRRFLLEYFGERADERCAMCDADLRPGARRGDATADDPGLVGAQVRHADLGTGRVQRVEDGRATILFEESGYRVIDLAIARQRGMLGT